jgi:predicted alpha/beta-hydrolase family hydrolase
LLDRPGGARVCYVLAHGAGVGMQHPTLAAMSAALNEAGIATFRFQFPYMEQGSKRPDPPKLCHATIRAAIAEAARLAPELRLVAGGRSFGGRMTSQAQALAPLPSVHALVFLAFPLHPAGRPSSDRAEHLFDVGIPMLFLQGTRDALAELDQLRPVCDRLGDRTTLALFDEADHSFHVPAATGRKDDDVRREIASTAASWIERTVA